MPFLLLADSLTELTFVMCDQSFTVQLFNDIVSTDLTDEPRQELNSSSEFELWEAVQLKWTEPDFVLSAPLPIFFGHQSYFIKLVSFYFYKF